MDTSASHPQPHPPLPSGENTVANEPSVIVGIDLGTTNSLVAFADATGPRILRDAGGHTMLPSVVRFPSADLAEAVVGREARAHAVEFPEQTVHSVKRLMGKSVDDVADDLAYLSYQVVEGEHHTARVRVHDRLLSPQEISAIILRRLREIAIAALPPASRVERAVITVPAWFDDAQRQATRDAGRIAGLEVVRIVNEPTAAALAYGIGRSGVAETIAVFDLGGGTFDVSILQITPASAVSEDEIAPADAAAVEPRTTGTGAGLPDESFFQVISTAGDTHLGGDDVDRLIVELVQREIREQYGQQLHFPPSTRQALRQFAEATKIRLSSEESARLEVDLGDGRVYRRTLERGEFENMIRPWVERALAACARALRDARMQPADLDRVVLVGGSTRIPLVRRMVAEFFGAEPYTALDPDLVVALGAAVQASILAGTTQEALLLDVIPLSLGVETMGGAVAKLIMRNSIVPCRAMERFSTSVDGQVSIKIHVLQGERELARDCRSLGEFHLRGLPPMPAGIPQVEVVFHVDANGILSVSAVEKRSGREASIQIVPNHGLSRAEVDRMELESYRYARQDMAAHRIVDLTVNARLSVKWIREQLARVGALLETTYRRELEARLLAVEQFIAQAEADPNAVEPEGFLRAKVSLDEHSVRLHETAITETLREG